MAVTQRLHTSPAYLYILIVKISAFYVRYLYTLPRIQGAHASHPIWTHFRSQLNNMSVLSIDNLKLKLKTTSSTAQLC